MPGLQDSLGILPAVPRPVLESAEPRWYAVHTRARHEKKVAAQLRETGVSIFLPLLTQTHRWSDRNKSVQIPLFSCYAFVRMVHSVESRLQVLAVPGVIGLVGSGGRALPIPDKEIEDIQKVIASEAAFSPYPFLKIGDRVRIRGGCMDGVEGILVSHGSGHSLVVSVELLQRSVAVQIRGYALERVKAA